MSVKERVYQALKKKNYFGQKEKEYLEVLEKAKKMQDVIIQVERHCNTDNFYFRYNPFTRKFHRITLTQKDKDLLKKEVNYQVHLHCIFSQCLNRKIKIRTFIKLLNLQFEALAIYTVSDVNI